MIVVFEKKYLQEYYETGNCSEKKHRYQPGVIKSFKRSIDYLIAAERKEDLFTIKSLHFEMLHGDKKGRYSVRAGLQYRIEFTLTETIEEPILTICNIVELSNHYE